MAPLLTRKKVLFIGTEAVAKGTPAASVSQLMVWDASINRTDAFVERKYSSKHLGHTEPGVFERMYPGTCSFKTELTCSSADYLAALKIPLLGCGMAFNAKTFTPVSTVDTQNTCTIYLYEDGRKKTLYGAMGNYSMTVDSGRVILEFEFNGMYDNVAAAALPSYTYNVAKGLSWRGSTFTFGTAAGLISTFNFSPNNVVVPRMNGGSIAHYMISDRDPTMTFDIEAELPGTYNIYNLMEAHTTQSLSLVMSDGTDKVTLSGSKVQLKDANSGDREGILTDDVTAIFTATNGDDEFSLVAAAA